MHEAARTITVCAKETLETFCEMQRWPQAALEPGAEERATTRPDGFPRTAEKSIGTFWIARNVTQYDAVPVPPALGGEPPRPDW